MTCNLTSVKKGMGTPKSFLEYCLKGFDGDFDSQTVAVVFYGNEISRHHRRNYILSKNESHPFLGKKV